MVDAVDRIEGSAVTASIGVASGAMPDVRATLRQADAAMYAAKRAGGNRTVRHRPGLDPGPVRPAADETGDPAGEVA
jgi:hypothetical protein